MKINYKYIHFVSATLVDNAWYCLNNKSGYQLGIVEYYPKWKQYVFTPDTDTCFSVDCLSDIINFISQLKPLDKYLDKKLKIKIRE